MALLELVKHIAYEGKMFWFGSINNLGHYKKKTISNKVSKVS